MQNDFNGIKDRLLQSPQVCDFLGTVWMDVKARLMADLPSENTRLAMHPNVHYKAWSDQQLVDELERCVGRDLQFIRIIGTLVGALLRLGFDGLHWLAGRS